MKILTLFICLFAFNVSAQPNERVEKLEKLYETRKEITSKNRKKWMDLYTRKNREGNVSSEAVDRANDNYHQAQSEERFIKEKLNRLKLEIRRSQK